MRRNTEGRGASTTCRLILGSALLVLAACEPEPPAEEALPAIPDHPGLVGHAFDPEEVAPGDSVATMVLREVDARRVNHPDHPEGAWVGGALFEGEAEVVGGYGPHPAYPEVDAVCFDVDRGFAQRLPVFPTDTRRPWFCFRNDGEARSALGAPPDSGRASVRIADYRYRFEFSDVYNEATLLERIQ